ncbi:MAG: putative class-III aminotransferase [Gemmatimonadetes bacterium]|nr:putative class-III aminotransferase [Gemmatimonadota bacterium]
MLDQTPRFDLAAAERLAREHFGIEGRASVLTSERDQNFLITARDGRRAVLKIANAAEDRAMLAAQQEALVHLSTRVPTTPRVVPATGATTLVEIDGEDGRRHLMWAITWLPGRPLSTAPRRSAALLADFGRQIGVLTAALAHFDSPGIHRDFYWDLANGRAMVARHRPLITNGPLGRALDRLIGEFDVRTAPLLERLPRAAIHSDLNDYNVLVGGWDDVESREQRVTGIVDFGDMVYSYRVGDLAIAIAYAILGSDDPLAVVSQMVRGYSERATLDDGELSALFGLVVLRLCTSVCIAVDQLRQRPDNEYLGVSQSAIAGMLPTLEAIPFRLAEAVVREAAGVTPVPASVLVADFLQRAPNIAPVLGADLRTEPSIVLDLSIASPMIGGDANENAEPRLTERVFGAMRDAGVRVAVGRYDEPRLLYVAPAFALGARPTDEHRTIHIGLDLFAATGAPVFAPLAGVVHAFADNASPQDYGPVIVLRHITDDGTPFFTLYGHLSRESLDGLTIGQTVAAGEQIATLGAPEVNGGWTPHLHLQIITDLLGLDTDFPGVARPTQRGVWRALCPDPNLLARVPADRFPGAALSKSETLADRRAMIGHNLSIAYRDPVKIVRGWKQYLYDDEGRRYIDAYNNVPHVGHAHPRVVEAGVAQMRVLNTNTRYLNDLLTQYADRLLETLPPALDVCYFVNSASEANELALRLTRAYTGRRDMIVLEAAYHGNTTSLIDISPYKHAGPGGAGAPKWVHVAPLPDDYRGPYKRGDGHAGAKYAAQVASIVDRIGLVGGFIAETCPSVGGQLLFPKDYLGNVYERVRAAGGVCIADEVQTGLGRMGTSFWAFEAHGVVPDMVVMGKPLGNGHPIAAVATTRAIADAFDNGMEYFSTFGGNTVSCAIGIAVLDVLRDEGLQEHARVVGDEMLAKLRTLADRYPLIGDVRGSGLFLGVELVRDRETLEPAGEEASFVANRMRERGILLGTDGPHHNVVKIRPPMPFSAGDADVLVAEFERALAELPLE